jgi:hypothetical protein
MLLITNFVELLMVVGKSRMQAGRPHAVSGQPILSHMLFHAHAHAHAALCRGLKKTRSERHGCVMAGRGMGAAWHL